MRIATKLGLAFGLHSMVLGALLVYHVRTTRNAVSTGQHLTQLSSRIYSTSTQQVTRVAQLEENAAKYWVTRDAGYLDKFREVSAAFEADLEQVQALPLSSQERAAINALGAEWTAFRALATDFGARSGAQNQVQSTPLRLQRVLDGVQQRLESFNAASQTAVLARLERSALAAHDAERLSWLAAGLALATSVLISVLIVRSISESVRRLTEGTRQVAQARFDYRLDSSRGDEFAQVARDFNSMTERLGELDRMKRNFISRVSHDLKTPLASMLETIAALLDELPGPLNEKQRRLLLLNLQSGQRLSGMLAKLLDLSRLEAGLESERTLIDPLDLIHNAIGQAEAARPEHRLHVTLAAPGYHVLLECDPDRILQLLDNLLENALKFSPADGQVELAVQALSERPHTIPASHWRSLARAAAGDCLLHITVADRGSGLRDEDKQRVFEPFYQTDAGRGVRGRGVGLGLTICHEIVTAHRGAIWVEDHPRGGCVFHVLLPGALRTAREPARVAAISHHAGTA